MSTINDIGQIAASESKKMRLPPRSIDRLGNDFEDYHMIYWAHGLRSLENKDIKSSKDWGFVSIRNKRFKMLSTLSSTPHSVRLDFSVYEPVDLESQIIFRDLLNKLRTYFSDDEWQMLLTYFEHGSARSAWLASDQSLTRRGYLKRIESLRLRCRKIAKRIF